MEIRIIKSPSPGTVDILMRRKGSLKSEVPPLIDAIGLVQGRMIEMVVAADIAEKAVGVTVEDIRGSCPAEYDTAGDLRRYSVCRVSTCTDQTGSGRRKQVLMITARLTDHIWSTRKAESLNGLKLMQAEIIGGGTDTGKKIIVVDIISAGIGDRVVVTTGSSARRMLGDDQ